MKDDYSIEQHNGRWIVWRLTEGRKLRQGSFESYDEAFAAMSESMEIFAKLGEV